MNDRAQFCMHAAHTHRGDHSVGLALPEGNLACCLDDDVAGLPSGLGPHNPLHRLDLTNKWGLVVEGVQGHWACLQGHLQCVLLDISLAAVAECGAHHHWAAGCHTGGTELHRHRHLELTGCARRM